MPAAGAGFQWRPDMRCDCAQVLEDGLAKHPDNEELTKALESYKGLRQRRQDSKDGDGKLNELVMQALQQKSREAQDLEEKFYKQRKQVQKVMADIKRDTRQCKLNGLTVDQLDQLPAETKAYRSVGKMFLAQTMEEVKEHLQEDTADLEERKGQQIRKKDYLELQLKNCKTELDDIYKAMRSK